MITIKDKTITVESDKDSATLAFRAYINKVVIKELKSGIKIGSEWCENDLVENGHEIIINFNSIESINAFINALFFTRDKMLISKQQ